MKIGTLSFARDVIAGTYQPVLPSRDRLKIITSVIETHKPDLLLCACDSVDSPSDAEKIRAAVKKRQTHVVIDMDSKPVGKKKKGAGEYTNSAHLISPDREIQSFPLQKMSHSNERSPRIWGALAEGPIYSILVGDRHYKIFLLNCGEVYALPKREVLEDPRTLFAERQRIPSLNDFLNQMAKADIILNPTHDRMGNWGGALSSRRAYLSHLSESKMYISCANWNIAKGHRATNPTLHTIYINGHDHELAHLRQDIELLTYEYRESQVDI